MVSAKKYLYLEQYIQKLCEGIRGKKTVITFHLMVPWHFKSHLIQTFLENGFQNLMFCFELDFQRISFLYFLLDILICYWLTVCLPVNYYYLFLFLFIYLLRYFSFIRCLCWLSGKESTVWSSTSPTQKPQIGFWTKWTAYIATWAWSMSSWKAERETLLRNRPCVHLLHWSGMNISDSLLTWQRR